MDNGTKEENKVKECTYIQTKMYILANGQQAKNMDKEHMYSMQLA